MELNTLDTCTYVMNCLPGLIGGMLASIFLSLLIAGCVSNGFENEKHSGLALKISLPICFLFTLMVALIPTHQRILEVKIAKIKDELVNKENVNKIGAEIELIVKKLNEKYLK